MTTQFTIIYNRNKKTRYLYSFTFGFLHPLSPLTLSCDKKEPLRWAQKTEKWDSLTKLKLYLYILFTSFNAAGLRGRFRLTKLNFA